MTVVDAPATGAAPSPDDVQPVANETRDRIATGTITILPFIGLAVGGWFAWRGILNMSDIVVFFVTYVLTGLGVTVGFHRHLTHRAFTATKGVRATLAILGSAAIEGPVISWVADHRKHHAFSDQEGDPHSPHVDHGGGWRGALRGLFHAHVGWLFVHTQRGARDRYAPDLIKDPIIRFVDRTFVLWVALGLAVPFALGFAIGGGVEAGLTGMLWGGLVRMLVLHHMTYSINSICHFFGRQRYDTGDHSRNVFWLALPTFGESWHNNHHAFPTAAHHGQRRWELDPSAAAIRLLEMAGLVWDVKRVDRVNAERKLAEAPSPS